MPDVRKPTHDVALALVFREARWLVAQRHADAHLGGLWEFPGGKRSPQEAPIAAAIRELHEETGVAAVPLRVLPELLCEYADRTVRLTPVLCRWLSGEPQPLGCATCGWVTVDELLRLEMPAVNAGLVRAALTARAALDGNQ